MTSPTDLPPDAPEPRLCHLVKWPDFDGYGFNLHAERAKCGQFIGKVDDESPAQLAGLREGDRIVEVNGVNIANENHRQVVERIKGMPTETRLLVVDEAGDKWYKDHKLVIKSTQANVRLQKTPKQRPSSTVTPSASPTASESAEDEKDRSLDEQRLQKEDEVSTIPNGESPSPIVSEDHQPISVSPSLNNNNNNDDDKDVKKTTEESGAGSSRSSSPQAAVQIEEEEVSISMSPSPHPSSPPMTPTVEELPIVVTPLKQTNLVNGGSSLGSAASNASSSSVPASPTSTKSAHSSTNGSTPAPSFSTGDSDLNLNMSVSQMRQMLAQKKKHDPKKVQMDLRQKYEIIQQM